MNAKDKRIAELEHRIAELEATIVRLETKIAQLTKNSGNSSKPPSSDIVQPPKPQQDRRRKRKIGAQPGHSQHLRTPFPPEKVDHTIELKLEACPKCGNKLKPTDTPPKKHQQIELVDKPFIVTEYQQLRYWCEHCQCFHEAPLPSEVKRSGLFGKKLIALTTYLKGRGALSYRTIQCLYRDALSLRVSIGFLAKQIRKTSEALKQPYEELAKQLPKEKHIHGDETGSKENGKRRWTWCFLAKDFTLFHIDPSRSSSVLEKLLGTDYSGTISCDFFGAYRKFAKKSSANLQHCWAHLIREIRYLSEQADKKVASYGLRLLDSIQAMYKTIHRRGEILDRTWFRRMSDHWETIVTAVRRRVPQNNDAMNMAERFREHQENYFRFIAEGIPSTNNLCEQSIRRVVLNRKVTQGTRSDWGNRWWERIWSVLSTCEQRGNNVMTFLQSCMDALVHGLSPPTFKKD